jgi:type I restriction enzyme S subunit
MTVLALNEVAETNPLERVNDPESVVSFVGMTDLDSETAAALPGSERVFAEVSRGYTVFRNRDLLVAKITPCFENGKIGQAFLDHDWGVGSTEFHVIRPGSRVDARYLLHFLRQSWLRIEGQPRMTGSGGQRRLPQRFLEEVKVPIPSLREQGRIAAILDKAHAVRAKRRRTSELLDDLTGSLFRHMFDGYGATTSVEDLAFNIRTGPFGSQLLHGEFVDQGVAVLGLDNVVCNEFQWRERRYISTEKYVSLKRYTVRPGDVLISIMGTTGRCIVVPDDIPLAINTKHICAITADRQRIVPAFMRAAFLWHPESRAYLRRQTKGSIMDGFNMGIIKGMPIPLPPLAEQRRFAEQSVHLQAQRAIARLTLAADEELFSSLQAHAFRGDL